MMRANSLPHRIKRRGLAVAQQHLSPRHPARRLASRSRKSRQRSNLLIAQRQLDRLPPSCHDAIPRSLDRKRGIRQQLTGSMNVGFINAGFMESVV
jgi:hypothetical protein